MSGVSVLRGGCTRGSRGVLMPSSRAGAARAAAILLISCHLSPSHGNHIRRASVHSSTSSTKSFSARQFERERENRLLAKARNRERDGTTPSPSPRSTENLLDDPLPSDSWPRTDDEGRESDAFTPDVLEKGIGGSMAHIDDPQAMAEDNTEPLPSSPPSYEDSEKQVQQANLGPLGPLSRCLASAPPTLNLMKTPTSKWDVQLRSCPWY
ncbi:unnamed protein product [Nesidiocoris tenuis]|uniref:Uncharacterized protein n=1 Tax=Nesidiocoris tenuis TaxID=355587 RepID=A0A6H5HAT3_9HEMI|nr:unnamed protein product [Nesidiocoris tenuis]